MIPTDITVRLAQMGRWRRFKHWFFHGLAADLDVEIDGVRIKAPGRYMLVLGDGRWHSTCGTIHARAGTITFPGSSVTLRSIITLRTATTDTLSLGAPDVDFEDIAYPVGAA